MEEHYLRILMDTEERVKRALQIQVLSEEDRGYGAFKERTGVVSTRKAVYCLVPMIAVYLNDESAYYEDDMLFDRIRITLGFLEKMQEKNPLFDGVDGFFASAPETAQCLKKLLPAYTYMRSKNRKEGLSTKEKEIFQRVEEILVKGAEGIMEGGYLLPVHKWLIASVLFACGKLFGEDGMKEMAQKYLSEDVECNEDGEFLENLEKNGNLINRQNVESMMFLSEYMDDSSYDEHAVKNLRRMLHFIEVDDSIFTEDPFLEEKTLLTYPKDYYLDFLKMGIKYDDSDLVGMATKIFDIIKEKEITYPDFLIQFMNEPELRHFETRRRYKTSDFCQYYKASGIVRARKGSFTYTVMADRSRFLYLRSRSMKMTVRLLGKFGDCTEFDGGNLKQIGEREFYLGQAIEGWYYLPGENPVLGGNAQGQMDEERDGGKEKKTGPRLNLEVWVKEVDDGVDLRVKVWGVENAPWNVELCFAGGIFAEGESFSMPLLGNEKIVAKRGAIQVTGKEDVVLVGNCFGEHCCIDGKGAEEIPADKGLSRIYLTDYAPFDRTIEIRSMEGEYGRL